MSEIKSGFAVLIGRPNVGKSTLMNTILQKDISIVTPKPQTTRNRINGIWNHEETQIVFVDTPGVHNVKNELDRYMNRVALQSTKGVDVILLLAPADEFIGKNDLFLVQNLREREIPTLLVITKTDLIDEKKLNDKIKQWQQTDFQFTDVVAISATTCVNLDKLMATIQIYIPTTGYKFYPDGMSSDQPDRFIAREIIREQILLKTNDEVPHSVAILVDSFQDEPELLKIRATIIVERESQKGILIGAKGAMIKQIGIDARLKMEAIFGTHVFLELFVKTNAKWRTSASLIKRLGYDKDSY